VQTITAPFFDEIAVFVSFGAVVDARRVIAGARNHCEESGIVHRPTACTVKHFQKTIFQTFNILEHRFKIHEDDWIT
jgi:hypothetical protein